MADGKILDMTFVSEKDYLALIFETGAIMMYWNNEIEEAGNFSEGILEARWSPNQENLLVATKLGKLILFSNSFDPEKEVDIDDGDLTFDSSETDHSIKDCSISWKGDSTLFVTCYKVSKGSKCLTRDLNMNVIKGPAWADNYADQKKNVVISVSEWVDPLMNTPVAFMPNGSLITGVWDNKIIFWEKNGLWHGDLTLPEFGNERPLISSMKWSVDT